MSEAYEIPIHVEAADIDALGHVNNIVYLRWVQEAAVQHWRAVAPAADQEKLLWIVLRHEIDYRQPAHLGDELVARTWVGGASRLKFERHTEVVRAGDRGVLAKALTIWCPIDARTGRPTPVSSDLRAVFSTSIDA